MGVHYEGLTLKRTDMMHRPNPHDVYKKKLCYAIDSTHFDMYLYEIRDVL